MNEYFRNYRVVPLWSAILLTIPVGMGVMGIAHEGFKDLVAGGPIFFLFAYGLVAVYINRAFVRVNREGIQSGVGPVPLAPAFTPVPRGEITKVYVRHAWMPTKSGSINYLAAGVQRTDGRWLDLSQPMIADDLVWREAAAIALALAWPLRIEELRGLPPKKDWAAARFVWYWGGAILAGIAWGCAVEFWFVGR